MTDTQNLSQLDNGANAKNLSQPGEGDNIKHLARLCETILKDPIALRRVRDRTYELLQEDIRNQRDRSGYARRRLR